MKTNHSSEGLRSRRFDKTGGGKKSIACLPLLLAALLGLAVPAWAGVSINLPGISLDASLPGWGSYLGDYPWEGNIAIGDSASGHLVDLHYRGPEGEMFLIVDRSIDTLTNLRRSDWRGWCEARGLSLQSGAADSDGDGIPNCWEYAAGSDPARADESAPAYLDYAADGSPRLSFCSDAKASDADCLVEIDKGDGRWLKPTDASLYVNIHADGGVFVEQTLPGAARVRLTVTVRSGGGSLVRVYEAANASACGAFSAISARAFSGTGDDALIAGFVYAGQGESAFVVRGLGERLAQAGLDRTLASPRLQVFGLGGRTLAEASGPGLDSQELSQTSARVGLPLLPEGSGNAALLARLDAGAYTAMVTGSDGASGEALLEVYEGDRGQGGLLGVSCRTRVDDAGRNLILGFVVPGSSSRRVVVRALGPSLAGLVSGPLSKPALSVYSGGTLLGENRGWDTGDPAAVEETRAAMQAAGCSPLVAGQADAAFSLTLAPGAYTLVIESGDGSGGVALGEVYRVP